MQQPEKKHYTPEEYLEHEEASEYKSEYYQGETFAMAGTTINHNLILGNLLTELNKDRNRHKCLSFTNDIKLWIEEKQLFTYPDLMIVCDKLEYYPNRKDTLANPKIIIEVLSDSTENYDRGKKFLFYRSIPSFKEYILIDQNDTHIEQFYIGNDGNWILKEFNSHQDVLKFTKIDFAISLKEIYNLVEFD
jgi:Uma2 family endonuclease